jgi:hypothetical protein
MDIPAVAIDLLITTAATIALPASAAAKELLATATAATIDLLAAATATAIDLPAAATIDLLATALQ